MEDVRTARVEDEDALGEAGRRGEAPLGGQPARGPASAERVLGGSLREAVDTREDELLDDRLEAGEGERLGGDAVGGLLVEGGQRGAQPRAGRRCRGVAAGARQLDGGGGVARLGVGVAELLDLRALVEPVAAGRAPRDRVAVAALPGAQGARADAEQLGGGRRADPHPSSIDAAGKRCNACTSGCTAHALVQPGGAQAPAPTTAQRRPPKRRPIVSSRAAISTWIAAQTPTTPHSNVSDAKATGA